MISTYTLVFLLIMGIGSALFSILIFLAYFTKSVKYVLKNKLYIIFLIMTFLLEVLEIVLTIVYGFSHSLVLLQTCLKLFWASIYIWDAFLLLYCLYYYMGIDKNEYNKFRELFKNNVLKIYIILSIIGLIILYFIPVGNVNFDNFIIAGGNVPIYVILLHLLSIFLVVMYMLVASKNAAKGSFKMIIFNLFMSLAFTVVQFLLPNIAVFTVADCVVLAALYLFFENPDLYTISEIEEAKNIVTKSKSSKTDVLVNISHDIKSPMDTIAQLTNEILKSDGKDKEKIQENIRLINLSGYNLLNTVNNIIDNSKLDGDSDKLNEKEYSLKSVLFNLSEITNSKIQQKPIKFIMNIDNTIPDMLYGDSIKIYQLLSNIISNAVKNTEVGKIALTLVKEINESNILLKFKVTDSGTGIPDDIAKKLALELEKTSDNKTVEENENKGVGLKIAKQYIDLMNGKIWFNSDYGAGTTFYVEIPQTIVSMEPMGDISATDNDIEKKELADYSKYKVLIVDDDYQSLQVSSRLLSRYKFNIETSSSRKDCIYRIKKGEEFDIIFVEPLMDSSNDTEILHVIKQLQLLYKKSYVVALTSNNSATARQTYFEEDIDAFILKPINPSELDNVLNKLLSKEESNQNKKADE